MSESNPNLEQASSGKHGKEPIRLVVIGMDMMFVEQPCFQFYTFFSKVLVMKNYKPL